jgi:hypothetical protein
VSFWGGQKVAIVINLRAFCQFLTVLQQKLYWLYAKLLFALVSFVEGSMARFVEFVNVNNDRPIWLNPDQIHSVDSFDADNSFTIIHFHDSNIKVEKHIDEVIRMLKG